MRRQSLFLLTVATLSLGFAPAPLPKPPSTKVDLRKVQGTWTLTSMTVWGTEVFPDGKTRLTIRGNRMEWAERFIDDLGAGVFTLDVARSPKTIDVKPDGEPHPWRGVYRLEGDTLTVCYGWSPGSPRPSRLSGVGKTWRLVFKRLKR